MKSPAIFAIISATALVAAAGVFYAPKSAAPSESQVRAEKVVIKKKMGKKLTYIGDVDADYIEAFRKCNSGQKEFCQEAANSVQDGKRVVSAVNPDKLVSSLGGGMKAPIHAPIEFNELMVRTAIKFATRKGGCRGKPCGNAVSTDAEQFRIYTRILKDARTGCSHRQLSACIIEGDLLAAEKKFSEARDLMQSAASIAKSTVSRCDNGSEPDQGACQDSRTNLDMFNKKSKTFYEAMLQSH